jgi:hypothetical protein
MFAFIALSLVVALVGSFFGSRNITAGDSLFGGRSLLVGMVLPVVAVGILGQALAINPLSVAAVMISAIAICVAVTGIALKAQPAPALARVRSASKRR